MTNIPLFISSHPLFASLSEEDLKIMYQSGFSRQYPKGGIITLAGDIWPYLFLVLEGTVTALKESSEGRSLIIATFETGELFWGTAFFQDNAPMPVSLEVRKTTKIMVWSRENILPIFLNHGDMSWELCRVMVNRMMRASEIVEGLAFQPVAGRVAGLLLENYPSDHDFTSRNLTLDEMAARIGTTREMVCRVLHGFSDKGLITITRTEFSIINRQQLDELAQK